MWVWVSTFPNSKSNRTVALFIWRWSFICETIEKYKVMYPVWLLERDNSRPFWSSFPFSGPQLEQLHVLSNSLISAQKQVHFCLCSHFQTLFSAHLISLEKGLQKPNQHSELLSQLTKPREVTGVTIQIYFRTGKRNKPLTPDYPVHHS